MAVDIIARGMASSGGGGGVSDYNQLTNKPKINGIELTGDIDSSSLGLPQYDGDTINLNAESKMQTVGIKDQKTGGTDKFWTGTKAEYDALTTHDENTFYAITDDSGETSSDVFAINLTEKATNPVTYSADKTHDEIAEAYNSNKIMVVCFDSSQLPMMNAQASGSDLGITFGYSQIQADGNLVITRAIHYLYTSDIEKWEDADEEFSESKAFDIIITDENGTLSANKTDEEIKEAIANKYIVRCFYHDDIYTLSYSDYDGDEFHFNNLSINISGTLLSIAGVWSVVETNLLTNKGGEVTGDIDMTGNAITNASKIHVDGEAPIYIGSTIEKVGTSGSRMTGTTSGEVAFVKATTQSEYVPILIGEPTKAGHAATKGYVDSNLQSSSAITAYLGASIVTTAETEGNFVNVSLISRYYKGDALSVNSDGNIVIEKGISQVKVSAHGSVLGDDATVGISHIAIYKNDSEIATSGIVSVASAKGASIDTSGSISPIILDVVENDIISLRFAGWKAEGQDGASTLLGNADASGAMYTYMTVEKL